MNEERDPESCRACGFTPRPTKVTRYTCPSCLRPWGQVRTDDEIKADWASAPSWTSNSLQEVVEYADHWSFEASRNDWIANGWRIASVTEVPQSAGCARILSLGLLSLVVRPAAHVLVVYERLNSGTTDSAESAEPQAPSVASELERLAALHERGALSDAEFERAKRGVVGGD